MPTIFIVHLKAVKLIELWLLFEIHEEVGSLSDGDVPFFRISSSTIFYKGLSKKEINFSGAG